MRCPSSREIGELAVRNDPAIMHYGRPIGPPLSMVVENVGEIHKAPVIVYPSRETTTANSTMIAVIQPKQDISDRAYD